MISWEDFYGANAGYALDLYDRYRRAPETLDAATRAFFATHAPLADLALPIAPGAPPPTAPITAPAPSGDAISTIVGTARLARMIREYGHRAARIDPLGAEPPGDPQLDPAAHGLSEADLAALPASIVWREAGPDAGSAGDAIARLRAIYSGSIGYEFDHVQDPGERAWLHQAVESGSYRQPLDAAERVALLRRLTEVEEFERFLHTTFQGQKRFSIEGLDALVPMLDELIHAAAEAGTREVLIGMAHRGRLNVLAHILGKPYAAIFSEFHTAPNKELVPSEGSMGISHGWTGDVKYHLGARRIVRDGELVQVQLTMAHNPSHLEFVNPVIEGFARAAQDQRSRPGAPGQDMDRALPVLIHGDAAFPGEGIVAETLTLSKLAGYSTGGAIHLIANNQIGFTTEARDGRSTLYASDLAKGFEIPIIHVNADAPEACLGVIRLAHAYRERFHADFLVDLVGYRRWGHNEGDEPSFTQPQISAIIAQHPSVRARYAERLRAEGVASEAEEAAMAAQAQARLRAARDELAHGYAPEEPAPLLDAPSLATVPTAVPADELRALNAALLARPEGFAPVARLERLLQRRRESLEQPGGIDWSHAEALAFASILADGTPIRLTGQDTERGTFSQRHLVLHDAATGARYTPLQHLPQARASFAVYNSPLSEAAPLGFEYGYSVHAPSALVLWEAQFGDFANAGQVIIDQFIAAARAKWRQQPALVLLLPHGYEGQGPEHSSARVERYLQLAAEDNLRVANCTTAAQYFHLLRAQAALLGRAPRPLVVLTPKSLLRHPQAAVGLDEVARGGFQPVLRLEREAGVAAEVERLILCSGKVAVEVSAGLARLPEARRAWLALARVELLAPFPAEAMRAVIARYPQLREIVWLQEEPRNMGAWRAVAPRLEALAPAGVPVRYVGRPERASTAEGSAEAHAAEQTRIIAEALAGEPAARQMASETRGGEYGR